MRKDQLQHKQAAYSDHARERAFNRLGIRLTKRGLENLIDQIRHRRNAKKLVGQGGGREVWLVKIDDEHEVNAVYDTEVKTVVSFLTPEMLKAVYGYLPEYVNIRSGTNPYVTLSREVPPDTPAARIERKVAAQEVDTEWPPRVDKRM
jgi:hypothetical protein